MYVSHRDGLVVSVSASHVVGRGLVPRSESYQILS